MLSEQKFRRKKLYFIGYSPSLDKYILATLMLDIWNYKRYYVLSHKEYRMYMNNIKALDKIAWNYRKQGISHSRYLCSEKVEENTEKQQEIYSRLCEGMIEFDKTMQLIL